MTAKELAEMLSGHEVGHEISWHEDRQAADAELVVIYGFSDDVVVMSGAIDAEKEAFGETTVYITADGYLENPACASTEDCECPYFAVAKKEAKAIEAVWHNEDGPCWTFETDIPHETFDIYEDGEVWCVGIVFSVEDLV